MKQLFHADILLDDFTVLKDGYLGIDGDTISYIGREKPEGYEAARTLARHLLIPGLYNMHTHSPMGLMRGIGSDLPLDRWLHEAVFPLEAQLTDDDISAGARLAMLEMLASGVVSFSDMYDKMHVIAQKVLGAGMKANLVRPAMVISPDTSSAALDARLREAITFYEDWHGAADGLICVDFSIHAEYTTSAELVRKYGEACRERGAVMHLHLSETRKEHEECKTRHGKTPTQWFHDLGIFESPTIAAHCVMVEPADMEIMRAKGVTAVHNPTSNMKLASGFMTPRWRSSEDQV